MHRYVLVINCGSSSLKFAVIDPQTGDCPLKGLAERLGQGHEVGDFSYKVANEKFALTLHPGTHDAAMKQIVEVLEEQGLMAEISAVGHRIVHGGEYFSESVRIEDDVRDKIADCIRLAPLHNPAHITGIDAAQKSFPDLVQVVVFDTAFHQKIPEKAYLYALPYRYYQSYHIRRYGFHGTSYRYVSAQLPKLIDIEKPKSIVCHLGNGGSVAAIDGDHSLDTTMGLTPLEGIVHGTRSGDIDPAIPRILTEQFGISIHEVGEVLWKKSGLLGLSEISNDCRTLEEEMNKGNLAAIRALEVYCYRLAKHIAAQMVALNGCDVLVFTGGIGENSAFVRKRTVEHLGFLGFKLDEDLNNEVLYGKTGAISAQDSKPIWVVPTNEELMIARDTLALAEIAEKE
ncbi:acetate/propionate family kinase [Suttonella ornithocola]|uniref:Acetate kinase n=1 Tax=Suttonella ornithocola TaxID=279832 RepID=A0A380MZ93_9GAMM|nr:acetate kinase [Suttonella ornithocola]SUO97223.1 Acetate kinase [Suttonella ornithocola]